MADCLFATTGGAIQCATHEVEKWDYDDPEEFDAALVPLCIRSDCLNCAICNKGEPCRSKIAGKTPMEVWASRNGAGRDD